jgi:hypothetical protein
MAKKGRDLFEILRERQGGGSSSSRSTGRSTGRSTERASASGRRAPKARGQKKEAAAPSGLQALRAWFRGPEPEPAPRAPGGLTLAAVAAMALLLGFVVGRVTTVEAAGPEGTAGLRRDVSAAMGAEPEAAAEGTPASAARPVTWRDLPDSDAVTRAGKVEEEKILSDLGFFLIAYPALEDGLSHQKARRLAVWLREQGLPDTRMRYLPHDSGSYFFAVISYTSNERAARDLELLQSLDVSPFGGELADKISSMRSPNDLRALARKKS